MTRKRLDQKAKDFLYPHQSQRVEQTLEQINEQNSAQAKSQRKTQASTLLNEILPEFEQDKEETKRFCVDLPKSLSSKLSQLSAQSRVPKTEIVRRLLVKALEDI